MSPPADPWTVLTSRLAEARRAASEGRFGDLITLAARLEQSAAELPPLAADDLPRVRQELADLRGVLTHVAAVKGALCSLRSDFEGVYGPTVAAKLAGHRTLDQRG